MRSTCGCASTFSSGFRFHGSSSSFGTHDGRHERGCLVGGGTGGPKRAPVSVWPGEKWPRARTPKLTRFVTGDGRLLGFSRHRRASRAFCPRSRCTSANPPVRPTTCSRSTGRTSCDGPPKMSGTSDPLRGHPAAVFCRFRGCQLCFSRIALPSKSKRSAAVMMGRDRTN